MGTAWRRWAGLAVVAAVLMVVAPAEAQLAVGVQASYADDFHGGAGVRAQLPLGPILRYADTEPIRSVRAMVGWDYFFRDCDVDCSHSELNANLLQPLAAGRGVAAYVGSGLNLAVSSLDSDTGSDTDVQVGLNALLGLELWIGRARLFTEAKTEFGGGSQQVARIGLLVVP